MQITNNLCNYQVHISGKCKRIHYIIFLIIMKKCVPVYIKTHNSFTLNDIIGPISNIIDHNKERHLHNKFNTYLIDINTDSEIFITMIILTCIRFKQFTVSIKYFKVFLNYKTDSKQLTSFLYNFTQCFINFEYKNVLCHTSGFVRQSDSDSHTIYLIQHIYIMSLAVL